MPPPKQRKPFVLTSSEESAQPVMDTLLANGMMIENIGYLTYSYQLFGYEPEELAFIFLPDFKDHPKFGILDIQVHGMIALGAIVKPIPQTRLEKIAEDISCTEPADCKTLQRITDGYGQLWEMIFNDVVSDSVGEKPLCSNLRQAAEKAVAALDPPCECYYCRVPKFVKESAPEEPIEYQQVFL